MESGCCRNPRDAVASLIPQRLGHMVGHSSAQVRGAVTNGDGYDLMRSREFIVWRSLIAEVHGSPSQSTHEALHLHLWISISSGKG